MGYANGNTFTGTYSVPAAVTSCTVPAVTATQTAVTITKTAHGFTNGDIVFLDFTTSTIADGYYAVTVYDANTFGITITAIGSSGSIAGTASATLASKSIGFQPTYVKVVNETANKKYEYFGSGNVVITDLATGGASDGAGIATYAATAYANVKTTATGFATASTAADVVHYVAVR